MTREMGYGTSKCYSCVELSMLCTWVDVKSILHSVKSNLCQVLHSMPATNVSSNTIHGPCDEAQIGLHSAAHKTYTHAGIHIVCPRAHGTHFWWQGSMCTPECFQLLCCIPCTCTATTHALAINQLDRNNQATPVTLKLQLSLQVGSP